MARRPKIAFSAIKPITVVMIYFPLAWKYELVKLYKLTLSKIWLISPDAPFGIPNHVWLRAVLLGNPEVFQHARRVLFINYRNHTFSQRYADTLLAVHPDDRWL